MAGIVLQQADLVEAIKLLIEKRGAVSTGYYSIEWRLVGNHSPYSIEAIITPDKQSQNTREVEGHKL